MRISSRRRSNGQIAVIEASAGGRWPEVFYQGARAALVLGSSETSWVDLKEDDLRIPVNFPRFYVPPGRLADELRGANFVGVDQGECEMGEAGGGELLCASEGEEEGGGADV